AGESGKSTIVKQMKIIHGGGYSIEEKLEVVPIIAMNILRSMQALVVATDNLGIELEEDIQPHADYIKKCEKQVNDLYCLGPEFLNSVNALWKAESIQKAYQKRNRFQLNDSAKYYFEGADRICQSDYVPTEQDVLRSRAPTTGIIDITFQTRDVNFRMVDVGGQRSERRKWIHCFTDVTSMIFIVALSEYDQVLFEDNNQSRMRESVALFDNIVNYEWFVDTSMILFLNKTDLFEEKIYLSNFADYFPEYEGHDDDSDAIKIFILNTFFQLNRQANKTIYSHFTCATDTKNIEFVFAAVRDTILQNNLKNYNLI
ncbi:guanine nucleotide-binding protein G(q) subunit alpha, partial [Sphaeroforma arctica JP610]